MDRRAEKVKMALFMNFHLSFGFFWYFLNFFDLFTASDTVTYFKNRTIHSFIKSSLPMTYKGPNFG